MKSQVVLKTVLVLDDLDFPDRCQKKNLTHPWQQKVVGRNHFPPDRTLFFRQLSVPEACYWFSDREEPSPEQHKTRFENEVYKSCCIFWTGGYIRTI